MTLGRLRGLLRALLLSMLALASAFAGTPANAATTTINAVADICGHMPVHNLAVGDTLIITNTQVSCFLLDPSGFFSVGSYTTDPVTDDITVTISTAGATGTAVWNGGILTINVAAAASNDATLSSLSISAGTLSPAFASGTTSYTATVTTTSITVTPTVNEGTATLTVDGVSSPSGAPSGSIGLNMGANSITVVVTAGNGTTTESYTLNVTRTAPSSDATLSTLTTSAGTLSPAFSGGTTNYTLTVSPRTTSVTLTPTVTDAAATVTVDGVSTTSGSPSAPIAVTPSATVPVVITAADGHTTETYTITLSVSATASRPDPTADSTVQGTVTAQVRSAIKLSTDLSTITTDRQQYLASFLQDVAAASGVSPSRVKVQGITTGFIGSQNGETAGGYSGLGMMHVLAAEAEQDRSSKSLRLDPGRLTGLDKILEEYGIGLWTAGSIGKGSYGKGSAGFDFSTANLVLGFDRRFAESLFAGIAFSYSKDHSEIDDNGTEVSGRALTTALYGTWKATDTIFVDASAGYSDLSFENYRWQSFDETLLSGDRDAATWFGSLSLNANLRHGNSLITPFLQTTLSRTNFDSYSEAGASLLALTYEKATMDNAAFTAGLRVSYDHALRGGWLSPYVKADFTVNTNQQGAQALYYTDLGASTATLLEQEVISREIGTGELGLSYTTKGGTQGSIWGRTSVGSNDFNAQSLGLSLSSEF